MSYAAPTPKPPADNRPCPLTALLVLAALAPDPAALATLFTHLRSRLFALAVRMLRGDHAAAEDLTQETMLCVLKNLGSYNPQRSSGWGWCRVILRNVFITWLRREKPRATFPLDAGELIGSDDPAAAAELADELVRMREAINNLPLEQRDALVLRHLEELKYEGVARATGTSLTTAYRRERKAIVRLREMLSE